MLLSGSLHGVSTEGAALYCTNRPCTLCAKMLINAHQEDRYQGVYPDELALEFKRGRSTLERWSAVDSGDERR